MKAAGSYIFRSVIRFVFFLIGIFAIYLFLRGHNEPGGGFIAGLAAAISLILLSLAIGLDAVRRILRIDPVSLAAAGVAVALASATAPMLVGGAFLEQSNWHLHHLPLLGDIHVGTPLIFDLGVLMVVIGISCKIIFMLTRSMRGKGLDPDELRKYSSPVEVSIEEENQGAGDAD